MPAADRVRGEDELDRVVELDPVDRDGPALVERDRDRLRLDRDARSQWATPMIGSTITIDRSSCSSSFASCVAPQMFASVEYAFSAEARYGRPRSSSHSLISLRPPSSATNCSSSQGL